MHSVMPPQKQPPVLDFDELTEEVGGSPIQQEPVEKAEPSKGPAREKKPKPAPAPKKPQAPKRSRKESAVDAEKKLVGIYFTPKEHMELKIAAMQRSTSVTEIVESAAMDALRYTYTCCEPDCHRQFTLRTDAEGSPPIPMCCPFCGSENVLPYEG